jgi:hypothetical protein
MKNPHNLQLFDKKLQLICPTNDAKTQKSSNAGEDYSSSSSQ